MASVTIDDILENSDFYVSINIPMDGDNYYELVELDQYVTEKELNQLIKLYQTAKRIRKTRIIKEGD